MLTKFSTPISELPSFLSTISMVSDDKTSIIQKLRDSERKSPSVYEPTRDLVLAILEGKLDFAAAMLQAWRIADETEKKCATQVLGALQDFLTRQRPAHIVSLRKLEFLLPNGLPLTIAPIWIRQFNPDRLMVLHFWQTAFTDLQLSAAAAVLRHVLRGHDYESCEIDFISVPYLELAKRRRAEIYTWTRLRPLSPEGLNRFWGRFVDAWKDYHMEGRRLIKTKPRKTLFDIR